MPGAHKGTNGGTLKLKGQLTQIRPFFKLMIVYLVIQPCVLIVLLHSEGESAHDGILPPPKKERLLPIDNISGRRRKLFLLNSFYELDFFLVNLHSVELHLKYDVI